MLGIKIGTEYLDLNPGTMLQLQMENPFLQFDDTLIGDFSLPFEVKATPKNLRLLQFAGLLQKQIDNVGIDASVEDGGLQHSIGKIKVEKPSIQLNNINRGTLSLYYLSSVSNFYQDIKDINLRNINVGGQRSFASGTGTGTAWLNHINAVLNATPGSYDYAFFPVINTSWQGDKTKTDVMNWVRYDGTNVVFQDQTTDGKDVNVIVPFPYLKYVLESAMNHVGWTIEGDILNDPDFKKICMLNFKAIYSFGIIAPSIVGNPILPLVVNPVVFNLQDHLPDIKISDFLIALRHRFGWWYDFDRKNKIIRIRSLNDAAVTSVKDFTKQASPLVVKTVNNDKKIFALRNQFFGDYASGNPDIKATNYQGEINYVTDLPAASDSLYANCYLVRAENNYYICRQDDSANWTWQLFAYNVYDYDPGNSTDQVTTAATTVGCERYDAYLDFIPRMDLAGEWKGRTDIEATWGIHLVFYHGLRNNKASQPVPQAGSGIYDSTGVQVANWSLAFECKSFSGEEVGLYEKQWKGILTLLVNQEQIQTTLMLNKTDYLNLQFSDVISINNVRMYIKTIKAAIPYKNSFLIDGVRI
jgi:hypothetical protein